MTPNDAVSLLRDTLLKLRLASYATIAVKNYAELLIDMTLSETAHLQPAEVVPAHPAQGDAGRGAQTYVTYLRENDSGGYGEVHASDQGAFPVYRSPRTAEQRCCASSDCDWHGTTDRMLGSIGPLCPECGEVTEIDMPPQGNVDAQRDTETTEPEKVWSSDGETYREDFCDVIDALNIGDTIHEGYSHPPRLSDLVSADSVIDDITNRAYDEFGEWADDWCDDMGKTPADALAELESMLCIWLRKHAPAITFWKVKNVTTRVLTADDFGSDDVAAQAALKDQS